MSKPLTRTRLLRKTAALLPPSVCLSRKLMFLSHPNSAPSHQSHPQRLHLAQDTDTQTLTQSQPHANSYKTHIQKIHPRKDVVSTKFKGAAFNLSCWPSCSRLWDVSGVFIKSLEQCLFIYWRMLSSHCRILQIAGDGYSRLNSNYWNAQTKALAVFYSLSRSLHHLWICCCRTVVKMGFRRSELPLLPRQKGETSKKLCVYNHQVRNTTDL